MPRSSSRRSFVVQLMSNAAGAWVAVSTGGFLAWLSGCGSNRSAATSATDGTNPPPPATVAEPVPSSPAPVNTMATAPEDDADAGNDSYEPPYVPDESPGPVVKYGGPTVEPPHPIRPMYGGPVMTTKYGGSSMPRKDDGGYD